jgi:hypothetical protein
MAGAGRQQCAAVDLARKRSLIQRILEDDAEVRRHTEPWMEHMRQYLGNGVRRRDVEKAYAAGPARPAAGNFGFGTLPPEPSLRPGGLARRVGTAPCPPHSLTTGHMPWY